MLTEISPHFLNSMPEHVAILDQAGTIQVVNTAWSTYSIRFGGGTNQTGVGNNYFDNCIRMTGNNDTAEAIVAGIQQVCEGLSDSFSHEYPCHSPTEESWILIKCWPFLHDNKTYISVVHQDVTSNVVVRESLRSQSLTDTLTKIANRRHYQQFLSQEWLRDMRSGSPISIIILDVDYFKNFNDRYGHIAGDDCLCRIAKLLQSFAKRPGDLAVRYGGEEFILLLGNTPMDAAITLAENIRISISNLNILNEGSAVSSTLTASFGVTSTIPEQGQSEALLLPFADEALYTSKENGRNSVASRLAM